MTWRPNDGWVLLACLATGPVFAALARLLCLLLDYQLGELAKILLFGAALTLSVMSGSIWATALAERED